MAKNKNLNEHRHWPLSPTQCSCGDRFRNPDRHLDHARAFIGKWHQGPAWKKVSATEKRAIVAPGHVLSFRTGCGLNPRMNKAECSGCGFTRYTAKPYAGPVGREHVRGLVKGIIFAGEA